MRSMQSTGGVVGPPSTPAVLIIVDLIIATFPRRRNATLPRRRNDSTGLHSSTDGDTIGHCLFDEFAYELSIRNDVSPVIRIKFEDGLVMQSLVDMNSRPQGLIMRDVEDLQPVFLQKRTDHRVDDSLDVLPRYALFTSIAILQHLEFVLQHEIHLWQPSTTRAITKKNSRIMEEENDMMLSAAVRRIKQVPHMTAKKMLHIEEDTLDSSTMTSLIHQLGKRDRARVPVIDNLIHFAEEDYVIIALDVTFA